jgi:PAS domain S-box-containing protein
MSASHVESILNNIADAVVTIDERGNIETFNAAAESMFGFSIQEVLGKNVSMLMPDPDRSRHDNYVNAYKETGKGKILGVGPREVTALHKDGRTFPMELSVGELGIGGRQVFVGAMRDITERRKTEKALTESEARYRTVTESSPDAILVTDKDRKIVFVNSVSVDLFAAESKDRLIGLNMIELVHPRDREDVERRRSRVLQGWFPPFTERARLRLDGSEFISESHGVPVTWDGKPGILIIIRDITHRKRTDETLRNLGARLINAHEDERSRIARELHDDFSQSLAMLTVDLELFRSGLSNSQKLFSDFLTSQIQRTKELSSRLQLLSRQLHPSFIEHIGLVAAISGFCNDLSDRHGLKIELAHQGVPRSLSDDVSLCVFRVVQEALRNIVKHSGARTARVELNGTAAELVVRISDTGVGFDPASDQAQRGLGLVSMRERLRGAGGDISITRLDPNGTQLDICVPLPVPDAISGGQSH